MKKLIKSVRFELSGRCQYKEKHKSFCPSLRMHDAFLSSKVILKVMRFLGRSFDGEVGFHNYNEPLIDPRLFLLITQIKEISPDCLISVWTNGENLCRELALEAFDAGVGEIILTAYDAESETLYGDMKRIKVYPVHLDDRLNNYSRDKQHNSIPCNAPFGQLIINRFGQIALCCMDWKYSMIFGNLNRQDIEDCLPGMFDVYQNLISGKRVYDVCSRCKRTRIKKELQ